MSISAEYQHHALPHPPPSSSSSSLPSHGYSRDHAHTGMTDPSASAYGYSHSHGHGLDDPSAAQAHAAMLGMHDLGGLDVGVDGLDEMHPHPHASMSPHAHILSGPSTGTSHSHSLDGDDGAGAGAADEGDMTDFDKLQHDYTNMGEDESGEMAAAGEDAVGGGPASGGGPGGVAGATGAGAGAGTEATADDADQTILGDDGVALGTLSRLDPRTTISEAIHRNLGINTGDLQSGGAAASASDAGGGPGARSRTTSGKSNGAAAKKRGRDGAFGRVEGRGGVGLMALSAHRRRDGRGRGEPYDPGHHLQECV